jgi:pyruvate,water dikinase
VDVLNRGVPGNVTTQMDLAVGDLTDLLRAVPGAAGKIRNPKDLPPEIQAAFDDFLARYGNRGAGEIDASRPRWRDDPSLLVRVMIGGLSSEAGSHRRHYEAQVAAGEAAAARLIAAAGFLRRPRIRRLVRVARVGMGLREHPKFLLVQVLGVVRSELLAAGDLLAGRGQLASRDDIWHLQFDETADALDDATLDLRAKAAACASEFQLDRSRKPPLAMTSEGEILNAELDRSGLPADALPGTPASAGVIEGIARVVTDPSRDTLKAGEILVAPFTDPGWTPLFVHAAGLVTEVGGMMTHGAVVAREYGIPAVVSVTSAVERIRTGQRLRVDGTRGFVQILATPEPPGR